MTRAGDVIDTMLAINLVRACNKVEGGLPSTLLITMAFNILLDFIVGLVPLLGDLLDAIFKANTRNVAALEEHLIKKHMPGAERERRKKAGLTDADHPGLEPFPEDTDLLLPGSNNRTHAPAAQGPPPQYQQDYQQRDYHDQPVRQDERTHLREDVPAKKWYTFGGGAQQQTARQSQNVRN